MEIVSTYWTDRTPNSGDYPLSYDSNRLSPPLESNWCGSSELRGDNSNRKLLVKLVIYATLYAI